MNTAPQSVWQQLARQRYPKADISGDGSWAVLIECYPAKGVKLFATAQQAILAVNVSCGHARCYLGYHTTVRLKSLLPPEKSDDWEDRKFMRTQGNEDRKM
jgi:hypothetical protein